MKKLIFFFLFILLCFRVSAQFNYKLKEYKSNIKASYTFNKSIRVNDIEVDTAWFYNYYLTNTKVYAAKGSFWTAITEKNVETLSSIIRSNVHNSNTFRKNGGNDHTSDFLLNTYLLFWNSSLSGNLVYSGLGALVELKDQEGQVIWNQHFYCEDVSMILKRKLVVQQFIDQLLNDLMSLDLDNPEFKKVQVDTNKDSTVLVVFSGLSVNDSKRARKKLEALNSLTDLPQLPGRDYISDYTVFYFKGNRLTRIDKCFDPDHKKKTPEDQCYRKYYFDTGHQLISVIDIEHKGRYKRLIPHDQTYDPESVRTNIDKLLKEDVELEALEDKYKQLGKENKLKNVREQRTVIAELISFYREEKRLTAEIAELEKDYWFFL